MGADVLIIHDWRSAVGIGDQLLQAGAEIDKCFLFFLRQAFDFPFNLQGPPFLTDPLFKNQFEGTPPPKIFGTGVVLMHCKSAINICGDAGIQTPISASNHIDKPIAHV